MTIGIDLSSLQGPHRMRGIGYTLINFINNISPEDQKHHNFIFYYYTEAGYDDPLNILKLDDVQYEVRSLNQPKRINKVLPGKFNLAIRFLNQFSSLREALFGDSRIKDTSGLDSFLQTDQMISLPRGNGFTKAFIAYDIIPYILEADYLWGYKTARSHGLPVQAAVRCAGRRWLYIQKLHINSRRADKIFAISDITRKDFIKYVHVSPAKISTIPLGVNKPLELSEDSIPTFHHYIHSSWGYLKRAYKFDKNVPYLLFVGGVDHRRKIDELVTAFNHLRGRGENLKLILAGDIMNGPNSIPVHSTQKALKGSSYIDDIVFMGFIDDRQRDWLYKYALAFVFPSRYEGFGLPVLEAFSYGCPVISFPSEAIIEVGGNSTLYASNPKELIDSVQRLISINYRTMNTMKNKLKKQSEKYSWSYTTQMIIKNLTI